MFLGLTVILSVLSASVSAQDQKAPKTPVRPALLVIDIQNAYLNGMDEKDRTPGMQNINFYIQLFRSKGFPVIRIYHYSKEFGPEQGTEQFEFPNTVLIKPDDPRIIKTYPDAFNKTGLDKLLKDKGVNTVFLCGLSSVGCVLATWIGAQDYDYKAFLLKDALISHNAEYTDNVEAMFDALGYEAVSLILDCAGK